MWKKNSLVEFSYNILTKIMGLIFFLLFVVCSFCSFKIIFLNETVRGSIYLFDGVRNIVFLFILGVIFYIVPSYRNKIKIKKTKLVLVGIVLLLGLFWINYINFYPVGDQQILYNASVKMMSGDYSDLLVNGYFYANPWQITIAAMCSFIFKIFGTSYKVIQILNVFSIAISYLFLVNIEELLFEDRRIHFVLVVLLALCFHPILFCTFVYGNLIGCMFSIIGIYFGIKYFKQNRMGDFILFSLMIILSILFKYNYSIVLIAMFILCFIKSIRKKTWIPIICILLCYGCNSIFSTLIISYYENALDTEFGKGMPIVSFIAMGVSEDIRTAPGWFNDYNQKLYSVCDGDVQCQNKAAISDIKNSITNMAQKGTILDFFGKKLLSEWGEPTFQALNVNERVDTSYSVLVDSIYHGVLNKLAYWYFDVYNLVIYAGFALAMLTIEKNEENLLIPLSIFGYFVYFLLAEAKSYYLLTVFILLIPYSAYGLFVLLDKFKSKRNASLTKS